MDQDSSSQDVVLRHRDIDPNRILDLWAILVVQSVAATMAAIGLAACLLVFYWFCRMRKRFRHRLIMLLLFGDVMKTSWYFIFAVSSIRHDISIKSRFCQASGFLIQYGTETCDYAVLVIAVHSALQVFRPGRSVRSDGLYGYRYLIYLGAISIPVFMASLSFVDPNGGYIFQGAFCTLPLRPYWYRLALAWVPRYLIACIVMGLAATIYTVVGLQCRHFAKDDSTANVYGSSATHMATLNVDTVGTLLARLQDDDTSPQLRRNSNEGPDTSHYRRPSVVLSIPGPTKYQHNSVDSQKICAASDQITKISRNDEQGFHQSITGALTAHASIKSNPNTHPPSAIHIAGNAAHPSENVHHTAAQSMAIQRGRIQRQIRLQFIYPLIYICMWIIPFTLHCLQYQDRYAQHPPFSLSVIVVVCLTSMGTVDCLIFSLRERPWRHMPCSDSTFWGSFAYWRTASARSRSVGIDNQDLDPESRRSSINATASLAHRVASPRAGAAPSAAQPLRKFSKYSMKPPRLSTGSTEQQKSAAGMAYERLKIEQEDRKQAKIRKDAAEERAAAEIAAYTAERQATEKKTYERDHHSESEYSQVSDDAQINMEQKEALDVDACGSDEEVVSENLGQNSADMADSSYSR